MSDHEHRRSTNGEAHRHHREKSLQAWVTAAFTAGIISSLAFLLVSDRARIQDTAADALKKATANDKAIAVMLTELRGIQNRLTRIEDTQEEILEAVQ
jgi:cysteine synthase